MLRVFSKVWSVFFLACSPSFFAKGRRLLKIRPNCSSQHQFSPSKVSLFGLYKASRFSVCCPIGQILFVKGVNVTGRKTLMLANSLLRITASLGLSQKINHILEEVFSAFFWLTFNVRTIPILLKPMIGVEFRLIDTLYLDTIFEKLAENGPIFETRYFLLGNNQILMPCPCVLLQVQEFSSKGYFCNPKQFGRIIINPVLDGNQSENRSWKFGQICTCPNFFG